MPHIDKSPVAEYPEQLYTVARTATPVPGLDAVTDDDVARYAADGFLAVDCVYSPSEVEGARAGLADLVTGKRPDFDRVQFEGWAKDKLDQLTGEQRLDAVRKLFSFVNYDDRLLAMERQPGMQKLVERLLEAKAQLFQDMALSKPPGGREKPWHQDHAYFDYPLGTKVVGVWIALDDVDVENGCMHFLAGQHKAGPRLHFARRDWQICDTDILGHRSVAVPLRAGGCVFFDGLVPHGTPANRSNKRRRALQFHYAPVGVQKFTEEERLRIFGGEGRDVTC